MLATEIVSVSPHLFHYVSVTYIGPNEGSSQLLHGHFQAYITHHGSHKSLFIQFTLLQHVTSDETHNLIAIHDLAVFIHHDNPVCVTIQSNPDVIARHRAAGRNVVRADVTDDEVWERTTGTRVEVGILALKRHQENLGIVTRVHERNRNIRMFAVASHEDEVAELINAGAESAWNMYAEAGTGLAFEVHDYYSNREADKR